MSSGRSENFHAGSRAKQEGLYDADIPTPSHAERARTMVADLGEGTLCTVLFNEADLPGHPYGSLAAFALFEGEPVFLISELAEHTRNLRADPRCSLFLTERGTDNPLALGRVTLLGEARELGRDAGEAAEAYFAVHPQARFYLEFGDFGFWRMSVSALRYIGGFGRMSWVEPDAWRGATPDPIAPAADDVIEHMNEDHADALRDYCLAFSRARDFGAVTMTGLDRYGFEMAVETAEGSRPVRVAFDEPLESPDTVRGVMVALVRRARKALGRDD